MSEVSNEAEALLIKEAEIRIDVDAIYNGIQGFRITLKENLDLDPNYFYSKIVEIKDATMKLQGWYLEVSRETERLTRLHSSLEMHYEILRDTNLSSNETVLQAASIADRMALINSAEGISNIRHRIRVAEGTLKSLVILDKAITVVNKNLSSLESNLTKQIRIFEAQLKSLGHTHGRSDQLKHLNVAFAAVAESKRESLMEVGEVTTEIGTPEVKAPDFSADISADEEITISLDIDVEQIDLESIDHTNQDVRGGSDVTDVTLLQGAKSRPMGSNSEIVGNEKKSARIVESAVAHSEDVEVGVTSVEINAYNSDEDEEISISIDIDVPVETAPVAEEPLASAAAHWAEVNQKEIARLDAIAAFKKSFTDKGIDPNTIGRPRDPNSGELLNGEVEIDLPALSKTNGPVVELIPTPKDPDDDSDVIDIAIVSDEDDVLNYLTDQVVETSSPANAGEKPPMDALASSLGMDMGEFEVSVVKERHALSASTSVVKEEPKAKVEAPTKQPAKIEVEEFDLDSLLDSL